MNDEHNEVEGTNHKAGMRLAGPLLYAAALFACTPQQAAEQPSATDPRATPASEPAIAAPKTTAQPEGEADVGTQAGPDTPTQGGPAATEEAPPEADAGVVYRAELERPLSLQKQVRHLTWTCRDGSCSARGPKLNISGKSCVSLGAELGSVVKSFEFDGQTLAGRHMEYCRTTLQRLEAQGKLAAARQRQQAVDGAPRGLARGEKYVEMDAYTGQMWLRDGGLRFVFGDGSVVLVTANGAVFHFDGEQRLLDHGRFARWQSVRGFYTSNKALNAALLQRCSRTNGGIVIKPGEIRRTAGGGAACHPHREDFRLIFTAQTKVDPAEEAAARKAVYAAPYQAPHGWKRALAQDPKAKVDVVVGSATSQPGYHNQPARDMLEKVQRVVQYCARYRHDPSAETKGTLVLSLGAFGKAKVALVRRATYPEPERMSACIEQRIMQESFQTTFDVIVQVPFAIVAS